MGRASSRLVALRCIRKQAEQAVGSKQESSRPPWPLLQLHLMSLDEGLQAVSWSQPFPAHVASAMVFIPPRALRGAVTILTLVRFSGVHDALAVLRYSWCWGPRGGEGVPVMAR